MKTRNQKITNLPQSFSMDLDPNQTNNVSSERSKLKAKEPVILKIHKHHFKEMVHRLTGSTCGRRFDMLRPPPFVVNNSPPSASRITTQRPYRFPTVPTMTDPMITSTVESLNTRPPSPPSLPREKDSVEARVMEDDMNQEQLHGSMLPPLFVNGDECQQQESIPPPPVPANITPPPVPANITPPPVPTSAPFGFFEWLMSPDNLQTENIQQPPLPTTLPSGSLDWANSMTDLLSEGIPPPVQVTSPDESLYWQLPESLNGPLSPSLMLSPVQRSPENSLLGSVDLPNPLNNIRPENVPPQVSAASPLWSLDCPIQSENVLPLVSATSPLDWPNPQNNLQPENVPPLVPATSPSMSLGFPNFQNTPPQVLVTSSLDWPNPQNNLQPDNVLPVTSPLDWTPNQLENYVQLENVPPLVPENLPLDLPNPQNNLQPENVPPLVPETLLLMSVDLPNFQNTPPPVPVTSPLGNLEWPFHRSIYLT
ncbi:unnamed protein product [Arabidopsis thaliana]|uniref:VQ domain-containing protein n=1 Tax=Arabidopsis thaliana TaxID=3702 RepID=A0A654EMW4_ARATH|nr:unnamed protein product [Arabidopsis thaliana]